jgi:ppGpp synthetase/RelA/SpoT-type nucleotidyltranferase
MDKIRTKYNEKINDYKSLEVEAKYILEKLLIKNNVKINEISSRVKTIESIVAKLKLKQFSHSIDELNDIVGLRVVCLFRSDIEVIGAIIRKSFLVIKEDNKLENFDVSSFGYMSVHFIVKLSPECSGPRYDNIKDIHLEIQIRTISMHAWATISHYLDYKADNDVPKEMRKDFFALSGLFYVADTHFESFYNDSKTIKLKISEIIDKPSELNKQEVNTNSLVAYFRSKFPDRELNNPHSTSELIEQLYELNLTTIGVIDDYVNKTWNAFLEYERYKPPGREGDTDRIFWPVGIIRCILELQRIINLNVVIPKYIIAMIEKS